MVCMCELIGLTCVGFVLLSFQLKSTYYIKMAIFAMGSCIIVLFSIPFMVFRPKDYRNGFFPSFGCRMLGRAIGVTMEVRGLENVRKEHGSVVLINHQSALDLLVLAYLYPVIGRATVVVKREILYFPFFGVGAWMWGTLFISRSNKADSIQSLNKESKAINDRNCKLLLFPEGTRHLGNKLLPFKKGSFHIALQSQCPVQPVVVSHFNFLNWTEKRFSSGHAIIHILSEISSEGYTKENIDDLITTTSNTMQAEFDTIKMVCISELVGLTCIGFVLLSLLPKAPYYVKMAVFLVGIFIIALVSVPFMIFRLKDQRNARFPALAGRMLGRAIGVTMEVRGLENVQTEHGGVVIINHQSSLDIFALAYLYPVIGRANAVSKKKILYLPLFGLSAWLCGTLFISGSNKSESIQSLNKESKAVIDQNHKILLYPEGTRNLGDKLLPFKKGAFHIAVQNQCPIQPIVVSHYNFLNVTKKRFNPGHAIIHILPEISSEGYTKENIDELITSTRDTMQEEFDEISKETKLLHSVKSN